MGLMSDEIWIAVIAALPPTIAAVLGILAGRKKLQDIHVQLDGRLSELLESARKVSDTAGEKRGREEERERQEHERDRGC